MKTREVTRWMDEIRNLSDSGYSYERTWEQHCKWWRDFWNRSWIDASDSKLPEKEREVFYGEHRYGSVRKRI